MTSGRSDQCGFSFIEVVIALALFAGAASIIVGLESSSVSRAIRDRNAQQAMLGARRIMASIEAVGSNLELSDQDNQPMLEVLRSLGVPDPEESNEKGRRSSEPDLRVSLRITDWDLPFENVQNPAMKKITLLVAWGDGPADAFRIDYLMPLRATQGGPGGTTPPPQP